jgi:hypothetical protein
VRKVTLGVDDQGRSCVVEVVDVTPAPVQGAHGVNVARVHATTESPPPPRLPALGDFVDTSLQPGLLRWLVVEHPPPDPAQGPTTSTTIHHSDALDLVFVHEGSGELMLQDGPHPVAAGDCIVMPGVDHAMRTGPDGIRLVVVTIGTPQPGAG